MLEFKDLVNLIKIDEVFADAARFIFRTTPNFKKCDLNTLLKNFTMDDAYIFFKHFGEYVEHLAINNHFEENLSQSVTLTSLAAMKWNKDKEISLRHLELYNFNKTPGSLLSFDPIFNNLETIILNNIALPLKITILITQCKMAKTISLTSCRLNNDSVRIEGLYVPPVLLKLESLYLENCENLQTDELIPYMSRFANLIGFGYTNVTEVTAIPYPSLSTLQFLKSLKIDLKNKDASPLLAALKQGLIKLEILVLMNARITVPDVARISYHRDLKRIGLINAPIPLGNSGFPIFPYLPNLKTLDLVKTGTTMNQILFYTAISPKLERIILQDIPNFSLTLEAISSLTAIIERREPLVHVELVLAKDVGRSRGNLLFFGNDHLTILHMPQYKIIYQLKDYLPTSVELLESNRSI